MPYAYVYVCHMHMYGICICICIRMTNVWHMYSSSPAGDPPPLMECLNELGFGRHQTLALTRSVISSSPPRL